MSSRFLLAALASLALLAAPQAARAQEAQPGDACAVANTYRVSGGPETTGKGFAMTCQGGVWVRIFESDIAGNLGVKQSAPQAPLHVGGEAIIGPTTGLACNAGRAGGLRWSSANSTFEMCDGSAWRLIAATAPASDCTPNAFTFTDLTDQSLSALVLSNTVNITGIDSSCTVSVSGSGTPEISVNGSAWVTAASINSGDSLRVRQISSNAVSTARIATVTIGSSSDDWSVTTRAGQLRIFVTSGNYGGNLGGLTGADSICQTEAGTAGYSGNYKAILSDSTTDAISRLTLIYPIVRANSPSTVVESTNLWAASLEAPVSTLNYPIWTGTLTTGYKAGSSYCTDWTSSSAGVSARIGQNNNTNSYWLYDTIPNCSNANKLYCIEQ